MNEVMNNFLNVNRTFVQTYPGFDNVLKTLLLHCSWNVLFIVHLMFLNVATCFGIFRENSKVT